MKNIYFSKPAILPYLLLFLCLCVMTNSTNAQSVVQETSHKHLFKKQTTEQSDKGPLSDSELVSKFRYSPVNDGLYRMNEEGGNLVFNAIREKSGWAFLGSAAIPGFSQAVHKNWIRAGAYFAAEASLVFLYAYHQSEGIKADDRYHDYADNNWSVVNYAKWVVDYNKYHDTEAAQGLEYEDVFADDVQINDTPPAPAYDTDIDWDRVNIHDLRKLEENTPFITKSGQQLENFSHVLPSYGSQQYYELISKYYQYGPGWKDFYNRPQSELYELSWEGDDMSSGFLKGARMADEFNDHYRTASRMVSLLIVNHIVSAFDAYFTVKLGNSEISAEAGNSLQRMTRIQYSF